MEHLDEELQAARTTLIQRLGRSNYERYSTMIEAAVGGRLSRRELDSFVHDIVKQPDIKRLHNRYISLLLEKLVSLEAALEVRLEPTLKAASLDPRRLALSKTERNLVNEAMARPLITPSCMNESRQKAVTATAGLERGIGATPHLSLSCQISGRIPNTAGLRDRLVAIATANGLTDATVLDESCGTLVEEALELHMKRLLCPSILDDRPALTDLTPTLSNALVEAGIFLL